jgi:putative membrane protein
MMNFIWQSLIYCVAVFVVGYLTPGVKMRGFGTAVMVALVLSVVRTVIDFLVPDMVSNVIHVLTLGLSLLLANVVAVKATAAAVDDFEVEGFAPAAIFSILLAIVSAVLRWLFL